VLGAIIGDISGSRFEWANIKTKEFEFLTYRCAVTDDSVMSLAVAQAILDCDGEYSRLDEHAVGRMREIGGLYPNCGYGGMFKRWLFSQEPQPYNSYGNGAAMRVSACGFAANNLEEVKLLVRKVTEVTHNHSEGIKGAEATAVCVFLARNGMNILELRDYVNAHYYPLNFTLNGIRDAYKFDVSCQGTVPQAIMAFLESAGFEDAIRNAISIGGDSDTLAAITGGIAEAYYGIPPDIRKHALTFLDERLTRIIVNFENAFPPAMEKHGNSQSGTISLKANLDSAVAEQVTAMLLLHFTNGYRLDSPIELARFRAFAAEELGEGITLPDEKLKRCISTCGITYAGKVYAVSTQTKERIKELAEKHFADGAQAIFFAEFYAKNGNWLFDASIVSETMLIGVLSRLFPNLSFTQAYFGYTDASVVSVLESEILRVWGDNVLLTYAQIAERLQYIPMARIRSTLGQNRDFIWNSRETFSHVSRIDITNEERETICEAATRECKARGYFSIAGLPSGEIEARNDELSITALHSAVFRICLSDKFDENGKIII
jgi:type I restriction enzyme M protein